jgi:hypothetical protein
MEGRKRCRKEGRKEGERRKGGSVQWKGRTEAKDGSKMKEKDGRKGRKT